MDELADIYPDEKERGSSKAFSFGDVEELLPLSTRKALIDGDMLVYACCYAAAKNEAPFEEVLTIFNAKMRDILYFSRSSKYQLYLTANDKSNYRYGIATRKVYKGNRADKEKPPFYTELRAWMMQHRGAIMVTGEEADDLMGIHQMVAVNWALATARNSGCETHGPLEYTLTEDMQHTIICTDDKDLNIIPGWHYRLRTQECYFCEDGGSIDTTKDKLWGDGFLFFCGQLLTGDSTDNIPGVGFEADKDGLNEFKVSWGIRRGKGFGLKGVHALLGEVSDPREAMWRVAQCYRAAHPENWRKYLFEAARLLWIRQVKDEVWSFPPEVGAYIKAKLKEEEDAA